ncbi:hypothetical protein BC937DRAFT_93539, partial [Endogone sp. FLAS-F59071]
MGVSVSSIIHQFRWNRRSFTAKESKLRIFVDVSDVASYVVRAVVDRRVENKKLWLDNNPSTQLDIVKRWKKTTGRKVQKKFISLEEAEMECKKAKGFFLSFCGRLLFWFSTRVWLYNPYSLRALPR